jgi:hypothetical protein
MNGKMIGLGLAAFVAAYILVPYAHELAHAAVCENSGGSARIIITSTLEARAVECVNIKANLDLYHAAGGLAGLAASAIPAVGFRKYKVAIIACLPLVAQQAIIVVLETFVYNFYIQGDQVVAPITSLTAFGLFTALLVKYTVVRKQESAKAS